MDAANDFSPLNVGFSLIFFQIMFLYFRCRFCACHLCCVKMDWLGISEEISNNEVYMAELLSE